MRSSKALSLVIGLLAIALIFLHAQGQVSFPGPELLGRPTDHSITINVVANTAIDAYFEYGTQSGGPYAQTSVTSSAANVPLVTVLAGLSPDTEYFYRMVWRQTGTTAWTTRSEYSFHTQRPPGSTFSFTIGSDSHINIVFGNPSLYQQTMQNVAAESPDFHLDLGDTFAMDGVTTQTQANSNYLNLRSYFGLMSGSVPLFLALGNHEQEEGWHLGDTNGNLATSPPVMSTNARETYYLNPDPLLDSFYSGNTDTSYTAITGGADHTIQDYYAWTWGDALFVVIDPYWYTPVKPYAGNMGGGEPGFPTDPQDADRWRWTLGIDQRNWLEQTLANSTAKYKFIFAHQVAGGMDDYGRGGANAVPYVEWGGYDTDGTTYDFATQRPSWDDPDGQLLVKYGVTVFFHGHDHEYAYESRDGVIYQLVPMAADATYGYGFDDYHETDPWTIKVLPNSGHLRVTVSPSQATVDYVSAFLPGAGTNGQIAYSYTIAPRATTATPTFDPMPGTYTSQQSVKLMDATPNATIHYTTDGSMPTSSSPAYTVPIMVSTTTTINAMASAANLYDSAVTSGAYTINQASTPSITVTPSSFSITTAQPLSVTVTVSGGSGHPTPTGSVTLSSGSYTSAATTLTSGSANIIVPAGQLAVGSDTLTATYTPDSGSSSTYTSATGTAPVTVVQAIGSCTTANPNPNPNPESFAAVGDFNGDCKSDILWRNTSTQQVYEWFMNGTTYSGSGSPGTPTSDWVIQGAGDFNGDGKSDILWRNSTTGEVYIWLMNGATFTSSGSLGYVSSDWSIQGIGDFNGDGKADILWRNSTTGQVYLWFINGTTMSGGGSVTYISSDWVIQGIGDFNGDGDADILWRNSTTGEVYIWLMNGTTLTSSGSLGYVFSDWSIAGVGDFNGDGKSDILWRNSSTGQVYLWLINGTTMSGGGSVSYVSSAWSIQGVGDYDGSGRAGILWRNSTTEQVYIWLMNGTTIGSSGSPGTPDATWQIAP